MYNMCVNQFRISAEFISKIFCAAVQYQIEIILHSLLSCNFKIMNIFILNYIKYMLKIVFVIYKVCCYLQSIFI